MAETSTLPPTKKPVEERDDVVIRFAGDSGDGMQLTGMQFTNESALAGNDLATFPDFPAEIRAPAGTLAGVSGFQLHFSSRQVFTPGDQPDVLVVMNPAAFAVNIGDLVDGGTLIADIDAFTAANLRKAGFDHNPLDDEALVRRVRVFKVPITKLTVQALADLDLPNKTVVRCKNFFALGLCSWLFNRPTEQTLSWIRSKFARSEKLIEANTRAFKAGWNYGETADLFTSSYRVPKAKIEPGRYTSITGNKAIAYGLMAAAAKAKKRLIYASYPITPASDILHELAALKEFGVVTFQAEDEIAAACAAIGAAYGGAVGATGTSGPGVSLKSEALGLAVMVELPMVIVNVQRGGPSTGLPTKTEQADLLQALYGRHGECPMPVLAAATPSDCFDVAFEAVRIAIKYMTPVMVLTDGYLANGSKPWKIPPFAELPEIPAKFWTKALGFHPYLRDEDTLSRPWVVPGTPGLEHRIGGLEKDYDSGNISYVPANHERMVRVRASKVDRIADEIALPEIAGDPSGDVLVVGWGSTHGAIEEAVQRLNAVGTKVGHLHLRWLHPLPRGLGDVLRRYKKILVPELNLGQLVRVLRDQFLVDAKPISKVQGQPFRAAELVDRIRAAIEE
ncbi:MAG: 2-oxoacid:acceptor oxidoreductase subunit alpha [Candidatus Dadabacteria bacterium]|nr:MAG: 2-oxoacid:acceptor oxidoreductase subunit alpha [Candidatus Dadabacteria bacterium]